MTGSSADTGHKRPFLSRVSVLALWLLILALGAYLRWSYPELTEFGLDQQTAVYMGKVVRQGWDFPLAGMHSSVGAAVGAGEYYVMAVPHFFSDAPEVSAAYVGLLGLVAGILLSVVAWQQFGPLVGLGTLALFATGPWAVYFTRKIWTPDTLPFFSAVVFFLLVESLVKRRRWALPAALLVLGLQLQIHFSALLLLPTVGLILLVLYRRVRPLELLLGAALLGLAVLPYLWHSLQTDFTELRSLLAAGSQRPEVDTRSLDLLQTLVSGGEYPQAVGIGLPAEALLPSFPGVAGLLVVAFWAGMLVVVWETIRGYRRGGLAPANAVGIMALIWTLLPVALLARHSIPLYFRYELFILPIPFLFPALFFARVGAVAQGILEQPRIGGTAPARRTLAAVALPVILLALVTVRGAVEVEAVNRAVLNLGLVVSDGTKDVFSPPLIRDVREAMDRLETVVLPDRETLVVGTAPRGPLEYLNDNRFRLRFVDAPNTLVLPSSSARMVFLPDSFHAADLALKVGAMERSDVVMQWPPGDQAARILEIDAGRIEIPAGFVRVDDRQVLPNGLELVAYAVENDSGREFDLTAIWRVARVDWAHRFWLYNAFTHVFALDGRQLDVAGELELSTSSNWRQGDLLVLPTRVVAEDDIPRGLYRVEMGAYVRFPARRPIPVEAGAVEVASLGALRLGKPAVAPAGGDTVATFESSIHLVEAEARLDEEQGKADVLLLWQAASNIARDYTVFVHVYDGGGQIVAQMDGWPVNGNYPTSAWAAGEFVADERAIPLPDSLPDGTYTVNVGLYDAETMERLAPVPDSGDRAVVVGTIEVGGR